MSANVLDTLIKDLNRLDCRITDISGNSYPFGKDVRDYIDGQIRAKLASEYCRLAQLRIDGTFKGNLGIIEIYANPETRVLSACFYASNIGYLFDLEYHCQ